MQVDAAFEYLERWQENDKPDVRFEVAVSRAYTQAGGRGIYLREPADTRGAVCFTARVQPTFHEVCRVERQLPELPASIL